MRSTHRSLVDELQQQEADTEALVKRQVAVLAHMRNCENSSLEELSAYRALLCFASLEDRVLAEYKKRYGELPPTAEMAVVGE